MSLTPAQVQWLRGLGIPADAFVTPMGADRPIGVNVPLNQVGQALDAVGARGRTQFTPNNITRAGPGVRVPMNADGTPTQVLEVGAGGTPTDLGLPPDPNLVQVTRTDVGRPGLPDFDATQPPPAEMVGQFDTAMINNPRGYVPNLDAVAQTLRPGGNIIAQGNAPYNPNFTEMLDQVPPAGGPPTASGLTTIEQTRMNVPRGPSTVVPKPGDVMGGPFYRTEGQPIEWPNTRVVVGTQDAAPTGQAPAPDTPNTGADTAPADAEAGAESGLGGAAGAGLLGAGIAGGMAIADDYGKVTSGQMSLGDAAQDVGGKAAGAGGLTFAGTAVANAVVDGGGAEAAAVAGGADALAGAAGSEAGAVAGAANIAGAALKGGVVGGVVAGGMALYDDVGKVESGQMTAGNATVDVTAKTAVGIGAGLAGAAAGAEIGAVIGTAIPIPIVGTAAGFVAGAVVGGAVGYVGNALMNTETGKAILGAAGEVVDEEIEGAKVVGSAVADAAGAVASGAEVAAGAVAGAVGDAAGAVASGAEAAAGAVGDAAGAVASGVEAAADAGASAVSAVAGAAESGAEAVADAASSVVGSIVDAL